MGSKVTSRKPIITTYTVKGKTLIKSGPMVSTLASKIPMRTKKLRR